MTSTLIALVAAAFAIWALVSIAQSKMNTNQKVIWFAIVILLPLLGPIVYWFKFKK
ncbi:MAG: PLD nuclease N-terminal domain-containing protein [Reichenbachiella sp.]|uniref:PLD nuclease N-terminal domain-containing protein n=1 Tax=Reichenbachiella sp. TaxID=2184521 RepID=UPI00326539E5